MQRYLEIRTPIATSPTASSDLARHLLARQHLGKTVIVCERPLITMSVVRKYWLKLSRSLQKERASTLNAEKILQLTHDITHMQHMEFEARTFDDQPHADVYFVGPSHLGRLPAHCYSLYLLAPPDRLELLNAIPQLSDKALVVDYTHNQSIVRAPLSPKHDIEKLVPARWRSIEDFFDELHLDIDELVSMAHRAEPMDNAIDVILNTGSRFMRLADDFMEILRLAQPLQTTNTAQQRYDLLALLSRRVYALTPGILSQQFIQTLGNDDLAMHDGATQHSLQFATLYILQ